MTFIRFNIVNPNNTSNVRLTSSLVILHGLRTTAAVSQLCRIAICCPLTNTTYLHFTLLRIRKCLLIALFNRLFILSAFLCLPKTFRYDIYRTQFKIRCIVPKHYFISVKWVFDTIYACSLTELIELFQMIRLTISIFVT